MLFLIVLFENFLYLVDNLGNHSNKTVGSSLELINGNQLYIALVNSKESNRLDCYACAAAASEAILVLLFCRKIGAARSKAVAYLLYGND